MKTKPNFWRDLSVGTKLILIPLFFLGALGTILYFTVAMMRDQQSNLVVIELTGRQRMLQQLHFSTTLLITEKKATPEKLTYIRDIWIEAQNSLIDGGPIVFKMNQPGKITMPPAPTESLRQRLVDQRNLIDEHIHDSDLLLRTARDAPEFADILNRLLKNGNDIQNLGSEVSKGYTAFMENQVNDLVTTEIYIILTAGVLSFLISWFIARGISLPLQQVVESAASISTGNLRLEKMRFGSRNEIGQLGTAFDDMLDNLKELNGKILSVTGNVNSASAEILASTQQQASSTREQAATVQEISTTMQEISQSGAEIAEKAKQVAASAEATSAAGEAGINAVQATSRLMEGIRQQVEEVATKIVSLSERTQAIGEIIHTVNEIAEQSNLLALNASIEAASAGEQGSRFAVVAGEMRNLAQRAKESTVQVSAILGEIQRGINGTVMLTEEAVKRSDSGKQQAEFTEQTIHQMTQTTVESVHAFQQIIGATNQQQIGFDQVTQGMRDIRQAAEQTAIGTSQLEKALANLNELSIELRNAVSRYQV